MPLISLHYHNNLYTTSLHNTQWVSHKETRARVHRRFAPSMPRCVVSMWLTLYISRSLFKTRCAQCHSKSDRAYIQLQHCILMPSLVYSCRGGRRCVEAFSDCGCRSDHRDVCSMHQNLDDTAAKLCIARGHALDQIRSSLCSLANSPNLHADVLASTAFLHAQSSCWPISHSLIVTIRSLYRLLFTAIALLI